MSVIVSGQRLELNNVSEGLFERNINYSSSHMYSLFDSCFTRSRQICCISGICLLIVLLRQQRTALAPDTDIRFFDSGTELTGTGVNGAFCQNNLQKTICESHLKWKVFLILSQQSSLIHRSIPRRVWKTNLQLWIFNTFYYKKYVIYQISVELCWKVKPFTYDDGR